MSLSEAQRVKFSTTINSDLYRRAREEVLKKLSFNILGVMAPEAGMALALEKGARMAFVELEKLCDAPGAPATPITHKTLSPPGKPSSEQPAAATKS